MWRVPPHLSFPGGCRDPAQLPADLPLFKMQPNFPPRRSGPHPTQPAPPHAALPQGTVREGLSLLRPMCTRTQDRHLGNSRAHRQLQKPGVSA